MKNPKIFPIIPCLLLLVSLSGYIGCATNNEFLLKCPFYWRKSDKIPGLVPPDQRAKIIQEKANKAATASPGERDVVVAQLVLEFHDAVDPNIRKDAIAALAKIPHPDRVENLKMALVDENAGVRIAAIRGLVRNTNKNQGLTRDVEHSLRHMILSDLDKDVRIASLQALGRAGRKCEPETLSVLEGCLHDKNLAIQNSTMETLVVCTGKNYGTSVDRWIAHFQNQRGESSEEPREKSLAEKIPRPDLPMIR